MGSSCGEEQNSSMLLSEKFIKRFFFSFSFELDFPYENLFHFHNQGTFRQETEKSPPKLSVQANSF